MDRVGAEHVIVIPCPTFTGTIADAAITKIRRSSRAGPNEAKSLVRRPRPTTPRKETCRVHLFVQCPDLELHGAPACGYDHRREGGDEARRGACPWGHRPA